MNTHDSVATAFSAEARRVLSIDGGGIKGVFPAAFLAEIERDLDHPIGSYFDLIVGTSTGGILAIGLALGLRASDLLRFYEEHGPKVFAGNRTVRWFRHWALAKYPREPLEAALRAVFGGRTIADAKTRLVIPSTHVQTGEVYLIKTPHHPSLTKDHRRSVVDAAMATAAAPSYFPAFSLSGTVPLVDGGVWANNPVGVAAVEAVGLLKWEPKSVRILSLGCTQAPFDAGLSRRFALGRFYWAKKFIEANFAAQDSSAVGMALHLTGKENLCRINPTVPKAVLLDSAASIGSLKDLGEFHARKAQPTLAATFFRSTVEPFTPVKTGPAGHVS